MYSSSSSASAKAAPISGIARIIPFLCVMDTPITLADLPIEMLGAIFSFLDAKSLLAASTTSKTVMRFVVFATV